MSKNVIIVGFGPGVGASAAAKFGEAGFNVALIARNANNLTSAVESLKAKGITAAAFPVDASDPLALRAAIRKARAKFGQISVLFWNGFAVGKAPDLLKEDPAVWRNMFDLVVVGLLAAADEVMGDLKSAKDGALLVTTGASWELGPEIDEHILELERSYPGNGPSACAIGNAARHRIVGLLAAQLKNDGVYVGEVTIAGAIKNTPTAELLGWGIDPNLIVDRLWDIYQARGEHYTRVAYEPESGSVPHGARP